MQFRQVCTTTVILTKEQQQLLYMLDNKIKNVISSLPLHQTNDDKTEQLKTISIQSYKCLKAFREYIEPYEEFDFFKELKNLTVPIYDISRWSDDDDLIASADSLVESLAEWEDILNEIDDPPSTLTNII